MAKTTSYEISKKLAEIGFKAETDRLAWDVYSGRGEDPFPAFDLETILEALPKPDNFLTYYDYSLAIIYQDLGREVYVGYKNEYDLHLIFYSKADKKTNP